MHSDLIKQLNNLLTDDDKRIALTLKLQQNV